MGPTHEVLRPVTVDGLERGRGELVDLRDGRPESVAYLVKDRRLRALERGDDALRGPIECGCARLWADTAAVAGHVQVADCSYEMPSPQPATDSVVPAGSEPPAPNPPAPVSRTARATAAAAQRRAAIRAAQGRT